jgi:hypothetical protein
MTKLISPDGEKVFASTAATPILLDKGYILDQGAPAAAPKEPGEKTIDEMTGKELDAFAAELAIPDWNPKLTVPKKRDALSAFVVAKLQEGAAVPDPDGLDDLSDEDLAAKVIEAFPDSDPDTVAAAIVDDRAQVIADLRNPEAAEDDAPPAN